MRIGNIFQEIPAYFGGSLENLFKKHALSLPSLLLVYFIFAI